MKTATILACKESFELFCEDVAPDKSISHRCAMFSLLSSKSSRIRNFLEGEDTMATLDIAQQLGAKLKKDGNEMVIVPPDTLTEPDNVLDCGNAGTGMRLYCGLLAGVEGSFVLTGDRYLRSRPMRRVTGPLIEIGAKIDGRENGNLAPLHIRGGRLKAFRYESPIDSAQVKSAMILAALKADGKSYYRESFLSRDHTERMLRGMGARIDSENDEGWITIEPADKGLEPLDMAVPADPSSAFFFAVAASIVPGSSVKLIGLTLNRTRIEAFRVLEKMGADIEYETKEDIYEPIGDIAIRYSGRLRAVTVEENIPWLIDELPALSIAMSVADGVSSVRNAGELRVKESDRIKSVVIALEACGVVVEEHQDGYDIEGGEIHSATIDSMGDHRIAMSFAVAGLICGMELRDIECVDTSFPNFFDILSRITEVRL